MSSRRRSRGAVDNDEADKPARKVRRLAGAKDKDKNQALQQEWSAEAFGVELGKKGGKRKSPLSRSGSKDIKRRRSQPRAAAEDEDLEKAAISERSLRRESTGGALSASKDRSSKASVASSPSPGRSFAQMLSTAFSRGSSRDTNPIRIQPVHISFDAAASSPTPKSTRKAPSTGSKQSATKSSPLPPLPPGSAAKLAATFVKILPKTPSSFQEAREAVAAAPKGSGWLLVVLVVMILLRLIFAPPSQDHTGLFGTRFLGGRRGFFIAPSPWGQWLALKTTDGRVAPKRSGGGSDSVLDLDLVDLQSNSLDATVAWAQLTTLEVGMSELSENQLGGGEEWARKLNATRETATARLRSLESSLFIMEESVVPMLHKASEISAWARDYAEERGRQEAVRLQRQAAARTELEHQINRTAENIGKLRQDLADLKKTQPGVMLEQAEKTLDELRGALRSTLPVKTDEGIDDKQQEQNQEQEQEQEQEEPGEALAESFRLLQNLNKVVKAASDQNTLDRARAAKRKLYKVA